MRRESNRSLLFSSWLRRHRRVILSTVLVALFGAALCAFITSRLQWGCGSDQLSSGQFDTPLECVSTIRRDGARYLLFSNPSDQSEARIVASEGQAVVDFALQRLPAGYAGACYRWRAIDYDPTPICTPREAQAAIGSLMLRPDDQGPYIFFVPVGAIVGAVLGFTLVKRDMD